MTRRKTKKVRLRIRKYKSKVRPREINLSFKENVGFYSINLRDYLRLDNLLEKETLSLLDKNVKLGIIPKEQKDLYLAFWRKVLKEGQKYSGETLNKTVDELVSEFVTRGLLKDKLLEIIELVKDQLPRKEFFHATKEWAVLEDWLKFKALAYVTPVTKFLVELIPFRALYFTYIVSPLGLRIFILKPKTLTQLIQYVIPTTLQTFTINLLNKIIVSLVYEISRYYTFTFTSHPRNIVFFDYELLVPYFLKYFLHPTIQVNFIQQVFVSYINTFEIYKPYSLQFTYFIVVSPERTYIIQKFYRVSFIYNIPANYIVTNTLTGLPGLVFNVQVPPIQTNFTQLKPKITLQFSYTITPA